MFSRVASVRRRLIYTEDESRLVYAAGPAVLNIRWPSIKNGLMMISKMIWQMFDVIGYSRYSMRDTPYWMLDTGCLSILDDDQKNLNMRNCDIEYRESRIQYHFNISDTVISLQKATLS